MLVANPLQLGEVVITGAGTTTTREKLGTVINTVDSATIARSNEPNIVNALAAKAPNVQIVSSSGAPGASSYIRIRGIKSLSGNAQPLFVVDGVPIDNSTTINGSNLSGANTPNRASDIDPADIETIDILKGAAAAAIYGARAADGVILITTKRGHPGQTRYSLQSSVTSDNVTKSYPLQTKYGQGTGGISGVCTTDNCSGTSTSWGPLLSSSTPVYDHYGEFFHTGRTTDTQLQISGGDDRTSFFASGGRVDQTGVIVGNNNFYTKNNARLRATHKIYDNLTLGGNVAFIDVRNAALLNGGAVSGLMLGALRTPPDFNNMPYIDPATGLQRSYRFPHPTASSVTTSRGYDNAFFALNNNPNNELTDRTTGNLTIDYQAALWLKIQENVGGDYYGDTQMTGYALTASDFPKGRVQRTTAERLQIDQNLVATAIHTFNDNFSGTLTLGQNLNSRRQRDLSVTGSDLIGPQPFSIQNTVTQASTEGLSTIHTESYFGQVTTDFFNQLYLTAALRNDGFSTFGEANPRAWYPKASAAWTFTSLFGLSGSGPLSYGKARLSYGETGKEPAVYSTNTVLGSGNFGSGYGDLTKATQGGFGGLLSTGTRGNPNLKPEREKEVEGGFDFGFFNQKADAGITHYDNHSVDVILSVPRPATTGFSGVQLNGAALRSKGWEATLNMRPITTRNFSWELGAQWAENKTIIEDLQGALFVGAGGGSFAEAAPQAVVGGTFVYRGLGFARCGLSQQSALRDNKNAVINDFDSQCAGKSTGTLYVDGTGFPVKDPTIRQVADPNPIWTGGLHTSVKFGNLQISGLLDHKQGGQIMNTTKGSLYNFGTHKDTERRNVNLVFGTDLLAGPVTGPGAGMPVLIGESWYTGNGTANSNIVEEFAESGTYTKLREISVAYTFDNAAIRRAGFGSIDLRVAGRNLKTWSSYSGLDPETNLAGASALLQGYDFFNMPQTRSFVFSIGLNR
jgi:TonB-linked SusC/RagA family outer membrane protein